jgi:hypothetical protein
MFNGLQKDGVYRLSIILPEFARVRGFYLQGGA